MARAVYTQYLQTISMESAVQTARVFTSGNSQAVLLPKEFRFEDDEVVIKRVGGGGMLCRKTYREQDLLEMLQAAVSFDISRFPCCISPPAFH